MKNMGQPIDFCRSSTEEQLTHHQRVEYINRMRDVQHALSEIESQLNGENTKANIHSTVKLTYGHFRDITDLLTDCLLIVRSTKAHDVDLSRKTTTKRKLTYIKKRQYWPYFIPLKWPSDTGTVFRSIVDGQTYIIEKGGSIALPYKILFQNNENDHLTLNNLETLHDKSHGALHPPPPFSKGINYDEYMESANKWYKRIAELIGLHALITETDDEKDKRIYLYLHKSDEDGQSHFYVCESQESYTEWSYIPKRKKG